MKPPSRPPVYPLTVTGTLQVRGVVEEPSSSTGRFDSILAEITEAQIEALRGILAADSTVELVRKIYRLAAASIEPGNMLARALSESWKDFLTLCLELCAFRRFVERAANSKEPRSLADEIEHEDREWLLGVLHDRFGGPSVAAMNDLLLACDRWTLRGDASLLELIRVSVAMAAGTDENGLSEEAIDQAIAYLDARRPGRGGVDPVG